MFTVYSKVKPAVTFLIVYLFHLLDVQFRKGHTKQTTLFPLKLTSFSS